MKCLLAMDSFKGCLTSSEAERAALEVFPSGEAAAVPVSDGGEGFSTILTNLLGGSFRTIACSDPIGRRIEASYGISRDGRTAIIEIAAASGIGLLGEAERNPATATTFGTGEMMADALDEGAEEILLGLGGSATCDGGTGLLQALGFRFITPDGILENGRTVLGNIHGIDSSNRHKALSHCKITGFYDVSVPFFGKGGSALMFAPQKGAGPEMAEALDRWMSQLCLTYSRFIGKEIMNAPGSGAAGGAGGAVCGLLGAEMINGTRGVLDLAGMEESLGDCQMVITGEGHADIQTLRGKVPMGVLEYVRRLDAAHRGGRKTKVVLMAGLVSDRSELLDAGFDEVVQITPEGMPVRQAMNPLNAAANLSAAVKSLLEES